MPMELLLLASTKLDVIKIHTNTSEVAMRLKHRLNAATLPYSLRRTFTQRKQQCQCVAVART